MPTTIPSPEDEALSDPAIAPGDIGNIFKSLLGAAKLGGMAAPLLFGQVRYPASRIAIHPQELAPNRFMTVRAGGAPYHLQNYPGEFDIRITPREHVYPPDVEAFLASKGLLGPFDDGIKGLNAGHALRRAADNWTDAARIQIIGPNRRTP